MRSISQELVNECAEQETENRKQRAGHGNQKTKNRKLKTGKSQAGLEMMAFIAFMLLAFSVAYISLTSKTISAMESKANEDAHRISDRVASEINTAVAEGNGYSKMFRLPEKIQSSGYNITIEAGAVFVEWSDKSIASNIIVKNITGNFTYGWNSIENKEGVIFAN